MRIENDLLGLVTAGRTGILSAGETGEPRGDHSSGRRLLIQINASGGEVLHARESYSISAVADAACFDSGRRSVVSENEVVSFGGLVAWEAGFVQGLIARFSVFKVSEPPAARRGVLF